MRKLETKKGFTLAETLIVVAIIIVLAGVSAVSVISHRRTMTKLEYDSYAKSIFIAAQNHLSMAANEGYLGLEKFGTKDGSSYYILKSGNSDDAAALNLFLPNNAVDSTVRNGCYYIRYEKSTGQVTDVYYWTTNAGKYALSSSDAYADLSSPEANLKNYGSERAVVGHYGGNIEAMPEAVKLKKPTIQVINGEKLTVELTNPNDDDTLLDLIVTGLTSKKSVTVPIDGDTYTLDDITAGGGHFFQKFDDFTPGENITVQAVVYKDGELGVAYSSKITTNSLFDDGSTNTTAYIANLRHLENLDSSISKLSMGIATAEQTADLTAWTKQVYNSGNSSQGSYAPVRLPNSCTKYDGKNHSITGITVSAGGNVGLFDELTNKTVSNLKLVDFSVTSTDGNAGALAGTTNGATVTNVVAFHSTGVDQSETNTIANNCKIVAGGAAGGLIGSMTGGKVEQSAAALLVTGGTDAGGLIGSVDGGEIKASYSGGHTKDGDYDTNYNVTAAAGTAGGLIGTLSGSGSEVTACYSTCSASGATAGGLVGNNGGAISNCYCTGLVNGTTVSSIVGTGTAAGDACYDFDTILTDAALYLAYTGNSSLAHPYDSSLPNRFIMKTVSRLSGSNVAFAAEHYGDWPAITEIFFVNKPKTNP